MPKASETGWNWRTGWGPVMFPLSNCTCKLYNKNILYKTTFSYPLVWQKQANLLDTTDPSFILSVTLWTQEFNSIFSFICIMLSIISWEWLAHSEEDWSYTITSGLSWALTCCLKVLKLTQPWNILLISLTEQSEFPAQKTSWMFVGTSLSIFSE